MQVMLSQASATAHLLEMRKEMNPSSGRQKKSCCHGLSYSLGTSTVPIFVESA